MMAMLMPAALGSAPRSARSAGCRCADCRIPHWRDSCRPGRPASAQASSPGAEARIAGVGPPVNLLIGFGFATVAVALAAAGWH
jgi:hypothetical protein